MPNSKFKINIFFGQKQKKSIPEGDQSLASLARRLERQFKIIQMWRFFLSKRSHAILLFFLASQILIVRDVWNTSIYDLFFFTSLLFSTFRVHVYESTWELKTTMSPCQGRWTMKMVVGWITFYVLAEQYNCEKET